eukprot:5488106-Pleurochrysis_carterae.AAC.1
MSSVPMPCASSKHSEQRKVTGGRWGGMQRARRAQLGRRHRANGCKRGHGRKRWREERRTRQKTRDKNRRSWVARHPERSTTGAEDRLARRSTRSRHASATPLVRGPAARPGCPATPCAGCPCCALRCCTWQARRGHTPFLTAAAQRIAARRIATASQETRKDWLPTPGH